jgi:hypothetical protein
MKTIYLKGTKTAILNDIKNIFPTYNGEIEWGYEGISIHWIGDIMLIPPVTDGYRTIITPATYVGAEHVNMLVPDNFDDSVFTTKTAIPNSPSHMFWI